MTLPIFLGISLFIGGVALISWAADKAIDTVEALSEKHGISSLLVAIIVLGVDLEEFVASLVSAGNGLTGIAIGNVVGNDIISLTLIFGLPGIVYVVSFKKIDRNLLFMMPVLAVLILAGTMFPEFFLVTGILALGFYATGIWYVLRNDRLKRALQEEHESLKALEGDDDEDDDEHDNEGDDYNALDGDNGAAGAPVDVNEKGRPARDARLIARKMLFLFGMIVLIYIGSEILVDGAESILESTNVDETFLGVIVVAAITNVEEYALLFASIRKRRAEIGINTLLGKILWNSGMTYGLSTILAWKPLSPVPSSLSLLVNVFYLAVVVVPTFVLLVARTTRIGRASGLVLVAEFAGYIVFNIYMLAS